MPRIQMKRPLLAPSLLSADFAILADEVESVKKAGADWLHLDIMDGHFVPNITVGPMVVEALRPFTKLPLDCHLMVSEPEKWIEPFAKAGANVITIHVEAAKKVERLLTQINSLGCLAGISLNPATPLSKIEPYLDHVDLVLVMSVNPGFGGQAFIESTFSKIEKLAQMRGDRDFLIEVDGGVNASNIAALQKSGVDVFVAGNAIFATQNRTKAMKDLRAKLQSK